MSVARRVFTISIEVEAPITVGSREICDVVYAAIELGVQENHTRPEPNSRKFRDVAETWDFSSPKSIGMRMAEEPTQVDTPLGPVFIKQEG